MHKGQEAEKTVKQGLQALKNIDQCKTGSWVVHLKPLLDLKFEFTMCLGHAYSLQHNPTSLALARATFEKLSKMSEYSTQATLGLIDVEMKLNNFDKVKDILSQSDVADDLQARCWKLQLQFMDGDREVAIASIKSLAQDNPTELLPAFLFGKLMWQLGEPYRRDKTKCLTAFLKAAKLDVYHGETFLYLGHYYRDIGSNNSKAKKCYQKAYTLDPGNEEAGSALADQFIAEGKFEDAVSLYEGVTSDAAAGTCKWAWLRLGLCHLKIKDGTKAIKCFLAALRADANDYICWECLGEGYIGRGSYNAAWKAFNKAHDLNPNSVYSVYQMAAVKQILGQHADAIVEYMGVLKIVPDYVPALKGLSESHLAQAKQMLSEGRDQTCNDHITEAIKCLTSAVKTSGTMSCLWKLLGECCNVIYFLHPNQVQVEVPSVLYEQSLSDNQTVTLNKKELLSLGTKCFSRALSLNNNLSSLWHDLGHNLFHCAKMESELSVATQLAEKSQNVLQKAISLEPNNHILWNSLGVVTSSKYIENWGLAQHSFIKSIEADSNNCWAWSNLGFMYLRQMEVQLAHRAFKVAQSLEPSFPNSWIGQALVAENIESHEAMDLFRHATELGLHGQSGTGYASWVVKLITECDDRSTSRYRENIHDMDAIQAAQTQLSKFCTRHPDCAWALTLHGFILEQSSLNRSAEEAYKKAKEVLESEAANCDESTASSIAPKLDKAKSNYARLVCVNGNFNKAAEIYKTITSPTFHDLCGLALSLRQSNKLKDALKTYQEACHMVATDEDQANVAVAMVTLSLRMKNIDSAKDLLLPWIECSRIARQTLAAIDIVRGSPLTENLTSGSTPPSSRDQLRNCLLEVASSLMRDRQSAHRKVQKYIHRFPHEWRFRVLLSHMIQIRTVNVPLSLVMARNGFLCYTNDVTCASINRDLVRQSGTRCLENHRKSITSLACSLLSSGKHRFGSSHLNKSGDDALKSAQRLVHCHPYSTESWSVLSASCYANSIYSKLKEQPDKLDSICRRLCSFVEQNSSSDELIRWSTKQKFLSLIAGSHFNEVIDLASEITDDFEETDVYVTLSECALEFEKNGNISKSQINELNNIATSKSSSLHSKIIASHALKCVGMYKAAHSALASTLSNSPPSSDHRTSLALRSFVVAFEASRNASPDELNAWILLCSEAVNAAKREESQAATILAEGLCRYLEKNHRKCRVMLNRALDSGQWYSGGKLCMGRSIAAWYLYRNLHERNDAMEMEKLLGKCVDDPLLRRIRKLLQ
uniref:Tetratricopeptide repeat protein 37-like n=1 Tax=Phallusia mammillata TaxID=59560 RepID=A0A6F9DVZ1_9ASCI|nr:tetratricopeptide repeat protein 37-like [Phallusia mammillata]